MTRKSGGNKRSSLLTFRRRLTIVRLLLRGPKSGEQLIDEVNKELYDQEAYPPAAKAALKHDLDAIKSEFGCTITYQRDTKSYKLIDVGELALLDLPAECMEALAFIDASFPADTPIPEQQGLRHLLKHIVQLLPRERQEQHQKLRNKARLSATGQAPARIDKKIYKTVAQAISERRELQFRYKGGNDDTEREYIVAPYSIYYSPEGHGYLDATLLHVSNGERFERNAAINFRLDRITLNSSKILPSMLPPIRPKPPTYQLRYVLSPAVARRQDFATYFPDSQIETHQDGSATITANITSLWQARQILLRYGANCQVHEPPELIAMFQETIAGMQSLYPPAQIEHGS